MSDNYFVDTNVLLYARDASEPQKQSIADHLLKELWDHHTGRVSIQVLNEYYVNVTAKLKPGLTPEEAWDDIQALAAWEPVPLDFEVVSIGYQVQQRYGISWWDSLIVAAAELSDCTRIYSEDLSDTQSYRGIRVVNPFKG